MPLSAVSNDEGELPHTQKSDEKESRSTTFIHCDACATGEGEWYRMAWLDPQSVEWDSGGEHVQFVANK